MFRSLAAFAPFLLLGGLVVLAQRIEVPTAPNPAAPNPAVPNSAVPNQAPQPAAVAPAAPQTPQAKRLREGTAFKNKHVFFRPNGERTVMYTVEENQRFTCLENLSLERILTAAQEKPERQFWKIDGIFTEFRGENFVFIRRAVVAPNPEANIPTAP